MFKIRIPALILLCICGSSAHAQNPYEIGKTIGNDIGNLGINDAVQDRVDRSIDAKDKKSMEKIEAEQAIKTKKHLQRQREQQ